MSSNPIQRKTRNSFMLGFLLMLIIAVIIGGFLYMTVLKKEQEEKKKNKEEVIAYVYALTQNVSSGQAITADMVKEVEVTGEAAPSDSIASKIVVNETVTPSPMVVGYNSKIDLTQGTILSWSMLTQAEQLQNDTRLVEYNMLTLPIDMGIGDYIDIRLKLPNGQDLVVISKKEIKNIFDNTVTFYLTEDEILLMNSAIVEAYIMTASDIYAIKYVEPGNQDAAQLTYVPTAEVITLMNMDDNITTEAKQGLASRIERNQATVRPSVDGEISKYTENRDANIEAGIQEQIENARAAREAYLSGLSGT